MSNTHQLTETNQDLSPERSRNIEVGAKGDVSNNLSLNTALFQTDKTNARVGDGFGGLINAGHQRLRSVEVGLAGNITPTWSVFGGYSYLDGITVDAGAASPTASGLPMVMAPKHNATLWTYYQVLPKFSIGGGAEVSSLTCASVSGTAKK